MQYSTYSNKISPHGSHLMHSRFNAMARPSLASPLCRRHCRKVAVQTFHQLLLPENLPLSFELYTSFESPFDMNPPGRCSWTTSRLEAASTGCCHLAHALYLTAPSLLVGGPDDEFHRVTPKAHSNWGARDPESEMVALCSSSKQSNISFNREFFKLSQWILATRITKHPILLRS